MRYLPDISLLVPRDDVETFIWPIYGGNIVEKLELRATLAVKGGTHVRVVRVESSNVTPRVL